MSKLQRGSTKRNVSFIKKKVNLKILPISFGQDFEKSSQTKSVISLKKNSKTGELPDLFIRLRNFKL